MGAAGFRFHLNQDQISLRQASDVGDDQAGLSAAVHWLDAQFPTGAPHNAQDPVCALAKPLQNAGFPLSDFGRLEPDQQSIAKTGRAGKAFVARWRQPDQWRVLRRARKPNPEIAVGVAIGHICYGHRRGFIRASGGAARR
jgi:hypothetical protein